MHGLPQSARLRKMQIRSLLPALCLFVIPALAAKRPITHQDFDSWRSITGQRISNDGHFVAYGYFPQEGDGEVVIRNLTTGKEWRENAGQLPPPATPEPGSEEQPRARTIQLSFTEDSHTLLFLSYPKKAEVDKAKKENRRSADLPTELVVVDLMAANASRVPQVSSFQVPEKGNGFFAYQKAPPPPNPGPAPAGNPADVDDEDDQDQARGAGAARGGRGGSAGNNGREFGSDLVLRKLADQSERTFPEALEYNLSKDGKTLVFAVGSQKPETNGLFAVATGSTDAPRPLLAGKGRYQHFAWDEKQDEMAFLSNHDTADAKSPAYKLYLWNTKSPKAEEIVSGTTAGFQKGFVLSERGPVTFSKDGTRIFFGAAPPPFPARRAQVGEDEPSFDLWHWKDDHIQPMQKVRAAADRLRSFRAVYIVPEHKFLQLANTEMSELLPSEAGRYALGTDDREYRPMVEYGERYSDSYLVDTETGKRTLLAKKHLGTITWSPDGRHALSFDGTDWSSINVPSGKTVNLTAHLPVKFWTEDNDTPGTPRPYGMAGWSKDGKYVLLYDHYDIWKVAPDGSSAVNITDGYGRKENLELRYVKLDPEEKFIDTAKPVLLRVENELTRESGFYTGRLENKEAPQKVVMMAKDVGFPIKAKDADVLLLTEQTFTDYPDLYTTDSSMKNLQKVSNGDAQRANYNWGTAEMVHFKNLDGVPLEGVLYKPENFDPNKKYPMIVYIYEKLSQNMNHFVDPKPMDSINITYYVSNGYLVFTPDIVYTVGYPGQSALKAVLAGVDAVAAKGFVDEKNIGIQGHSWGGYQIAYMITQTTRFKAVEAGAPVANMTSAYNGIRWGPGLPRQFQYEKTQSRIGGTLWEYPLRFLENSPIFKADRVKTPLLMVHNDADDAVPWYQGVEYYLALRRLGKEVYLFTYNGEPHHLRRRANQKDYAIRMAQYFDYELKGGPKPAWMEHGIPYLHAPEGPESNTTDRENVVH